MPATALALVLAAGLIHALWNIAAKKAGGDARFTCFVSALVIVVWSPVALWLGWHELPGWGLREWAAVAVSGFAHWLYFWCLLSGYRKADLTVVYPVARGSGPLITALVSVGLLGERLSLAGAFGIGSVVAGVFLVAGGPQLWRSVHLGDAQARQRIRTGLLWGAATGLLIACYTVLDAWAVKALLISPLLLDYFSHVLRLPYSLVPVLGDRAEARRLWHAQWPYALIVAVGGVAGYVLVLYAMRMAPISHVASAREVSMLFATLIGGRLLGEEGRLPRLMGASLIAMGVGMLSWPSSG